jgi:hypothetical protein
VGRVVMREVKRPIESRSEFVCENKKDFIQADLKEVL